MRFNIVATEGMMPNRETNQLTNKWLTRGHSGFPDGKERKFAYSVEEIAESDYLYL
jgi:hypothetical protein